MANNNALTPQDRDIPLESMPNQERPALDDYDPNTKDLGYSEPLPIDDDTGEAQQQMAGETAWINLVRQSFSSAVDWRESSIADQWERSLNHHNGEFDRTSVLFRDRSDRRQGVRRRHLFRPKTRAGERQFGAAVASALFSNADVVDVQAGNRSNNEQRVSAMYLKSLIQHHLTKTIPWYLTALGAAQDCYNYGCCVTAVDWKHQYRTSKDLEPMLDEVGEPMIDEASGYPMFEEVQRMEVVKDQPEMRDLEPENFLADPACDWRDPVNSSPYIHEVMPMYAGDVLDIMEQERPEDLEGPPPWRKLSLQQILSTSRDEYDSTRSAREGDERQDPYDLENSNEFTIVYVHRVFMRQNGEDYVFWTMGTQYLLTEPKPVREVYPWSKGRPIVFGVALIDTHKYIPQSHNHLVGDLQEYINIVANQRVENVRLALNKRWLLRRGAQIDLEALIRNVPGGGIFTNDPNKDIREITTADVTSSSYQEHARLDSEVDDITGSFSGSSVQNNRQLNETATGMQLLQAGSNQVTDFDIRTWVETWAEPVLQMLAQVIQQYETDERVLNVAMDNIEGEMQKFDVEEITDQMLREQMNVTVNVGIGATNPIDKVNRLTLGVQTAANLGEPVNGPEVVKEIFAQLGYSDASRFVLTPEQMAEQQPRGPSPDEMKMQLEQQRLEMDMQFKKAQLQMEQQRAQFEVNKLAMEKAMQEQEQQFGIQKLALEKALEEQKLQNELEIQQAKLRTQRDIAALKGANTQSELKLKRETGEGI